MTRQKGRHIMSKFPKGFFIGAATAAHQVEGNNVNSDCWAQEQMQNSTFDEPSLDAVDHYNRYEEDICLMAQSGLNAYRFSIEWARVEPVQGTFDAEAIVHYRAVLECCHANGIEPIVTMHHFSSPKWLIATGGWEDEKTITAFVKYCAYVVSQLGDLMCYVCTINEANMGVQIAAIAARYRKQMQHQANVEGDKNLQVGINLESNPVMEKMKLQAMENIQVFGTAKPETFLSMRTQAGDALIARAHVAARAAMKQIKPGLKIGITLSLHDIQPLEGCEALAQKEWNEEFSHYLPYIQEDDFIGLQNYTRSIIGKDGIMPIPEGAQLTQMGYEYYPKALENVIRRVQQELSIPILVTENGIATEDDSQRIAYIQEALTGVQRCLSDQIPVLGYLYWSLLDNFEWQKGYCKTFGLIAVDHTTQRRYPKESLHYLGGYLK